MEHLVPGIPETMCYASFEKDCFPFMGKLFQPAKYLVTDLAFNNS
jgi:hypothetical protein